MEKTKAHRLAGGPDMCPLLFDHNGKKTCSVKLIPCDVYTVYGFCPIYAAWKSSKKFCTVRLE